jgi:hypothetical protein
MLKIMRGYSSVRLKLFNKKPHTYCHQNMHKLQQTFLVLFFLISYDNAKDTTYHKNDNTWNDYFTP